MTKTRNQARLELQEPNRKNIRKAPLPKAVKPKEPKPQSIGKCLAGDPFPDLEPAKPLPAIPDRVELVSVEWKVDLEESRASYCDCLTRLGWEF